MQVEIPYYQVNLNAEGEQAEIYTAMLADAGFESFLEEGSQLQAFAQANDFNSVMVQELLTELRQNNSLNLEIIPHKKENWNQSWESHFEPVLIGDQVYIRAEHHVARPEVAIELVIQPKMSFGTGHHDTTSLMIQALLGIDLRGLRVLDAGTGTGVLAMVAARRGATYTAAFDHEDWSIENALENAERNNLGQIDFQCADIADYKADAPFEVVLANITRNLVMANLARLADWTIPNGHLLLSGFYEHDTHQVAQAAEALGLRQTDLLTQKGAAEPRWCALHLSK